MANLKLALMALALSFLLPALSFAATTTIPAGVQPQLEVLPQGQSVTITAGVNGTAIIQRFRGSTQLDQTALAASQSQSYGPYNADIQFRISALQDAVTFAAQESVVQIADAANPAAFSSFSIWTNPSNGANAKKWGMTAQYDDSGPGVQNTLALMALNDDLSNPALTDPRSISSGYPLYGCNNVVVANGEGAAAVSPALPTDVNYVALGPSTANGCPQAYIDINGDGGLNGTWGVTGELQLWGTDPVVKYFKDNGATPVWAEGIVDYAGSPTHWQLYDMVFGGSIIDAVANGDVDLHPAGKITYKGGPFLRVMNVEDSGDLVCDGSTDNSTIINLALAAFRTSVNNGVPAKLVFPNHFFNSCAVAHPLNFAGIQPGNLAASVIDGQGVSVNCTMTGGVCLDASATYGVKLENFYVAGSGADIGLQFAAQSDTSENCGSNFIENVVINGYFNIAPMLNDGCEGNYYNDDFFGNQKVSTSTYSAIFDGDNHWNAQSTFVSLTRTVDANQSFNENYCIRCVFANYGGGRLLWIANSHHMEFINSYGHNENSTLAPVVLYDEGQGNNWNLNVDIHFEIAPTATFLLSGSNASPVELGLTYKDHYNQATASIFALDTGVTAPTLHNLSLNVANFLHTPTVFDSPSAYTVDGSVYVPAGSFWNAPASFSGSLNKGGAFTYWQGNLQLLPALTGTTGSLGGSALTIGACSSITVAVTGATTSMTVEATPAAYPGDGAYWRGYVSSAGTVTVKVCENGSATPAATTYNVRVLQ